jgi:hypothetical protein
MTTRGAIHAGLGVMLAAAACTVCAQESLRQPPLPTFDATQLTPDRYTVVRRLWVESWRTAFDVPAHAESSAALTQLSDEAARVGADALTNVVCLDDNRAWFRSGYFCYALAVKRK